MAKSKGYILAYFSAFIGIISILTPVAYHNSALLESYIWMWGLYTEKVLLGDTTFNFSNDSEYLLWGLLGTLMILFAIILLISTARKASKRKGKFGFLWFVCGLMFIAAPLVFYFGLTAEIPAWLTDLFWEIYNVHFGFFGAFIAGGLAIIAAIIK